MGRYIAVARARSSAVFYPYDSFSLNFKLDDRQPFTLTFRTDYIDGFEAPAPRDLIAEAEGDVEDLETAAEIFTNAARDIAAIIGLVANASVGLLELALIYDVSPDASEHEFLQSLVVVPPVLAIPGRRIDIQLVRCTVDAIEVHPERKRMQRAIAQYNQALNTWTPGHEIACVAHLYMGVEALTKAVFRNYLRASGRSEDDLVSSWAIDTSTLIARRRGLDSEARRRLIFRGDDDCYRKAKRISDAFEHGFDDYGSMQKPAREVIVRTANYLRRAILELIQLPSEALERLLSDAYVEARGPISLVRYVRGVLIGDASKLAAQGKQHPYLDWKSKLKVVRIQENGKYGFQPDDTLTARIGEGIQFRVSSYEMWDGSAIKELVADSTKTSTSA